MNFPSIYLLDERILGALFSQTNEEEFIWLYEKAANISPRPFQASSLGE
jgi:hypothetical protein